MSFAQDISSNLPWWKTTDENQCLNNIKECTTNQQKSGNSKLTFTETVMLFFPSQYDCAALTLNFLAFIALYYQNLGSCSSLSYFFVCEHTLWLGGLSIRGNRLYNVKEKVHVLKICVFSHEGIWYKIPL